MTMLTWLALGVGPVRPCGPEQPKPTITPAEWDPETARLNPDQRLIEGNPFLVGTYRHDITVFCSFSDASNLTIRGARDPDDPQAVETVRLNSTTIQMSLNKPDVGWYSYYCTDSHTNCTGTLYIKVRPAMSVTAPQIHHTLDKYGKTLYFVLVGESYDVFCSAQIALSVAWEEELETKPFNETTVMATVTDHTEGERVYYCWNPESLAEIRVMVYHYPGASEFKCVLYQQRVGCSWKSDKGNSFKLFMSFIMFEQESILICIDRSGALAAGCTGPLDEESTSLLIHYHYYNISFQLETCNTVFCSNQTFNFDIDSITKVEPVYDLEVRNVSALGAIVSWRQHIDFLSDYKVEYRLLGTDWHPVNASAVRCEYVNVCGIPLALPCPDTHYALRIFLKYKEATSDVYWSEPAYIYFFTASSSGEVDHACNADFRDVTEKPPLSANLVLYKIRELISDERKETKALKKKLDTLKEKLVKLKAIMASGHTHSRYT